MGSVAQFNLADGEQRAELPLIVDLDGTLIAGDTLLESIVQLARAFPLSLLALPFWLLKGRAGFKDEIARRCRLDTTALPYRSEVLQHLREQKERGRKVLLTTAAHQSIADAVASHVGIFDQAIGTRAGVNLKGSTKLEAIRAAVGNDFVYAGDSRADLPIWRSARAAILVAASGRVRAAVRETTPVEHEFNGRAATWSDWRRALRVHQWVKNVLLFVPMLTSFSFIGLADLARMLAAFIAFSLCASATYILNDLWDLQNDRAHPRKRHRPFASGAIPIIAGARMSAFLMLCGFALAWTASPAFTALLALYVVLTTTYSWALKEYVLLDVLMLAVLYTLRILAGAVALGVAVSSWLLVFSIFTFFSLALVKRCSELQSLAANGVLGTRGRDYRASDLIVLWPLGAGASLCAVVVFGLFISAPETQARYGTPFLLWLDALGLIYWTSRLWIKTARGEMDDDPVVYALKDRGSRTVLLSMGAVTIAARLLSLPL